MIENYVQTFLGGCKGIGLSRRGDADPHVCFAILTHDDGNWFVDNSSSSGYWIPELIDQLQAATNWCNKNCILTTYGWEFKS